VQCFAALIAYMHIIYIAHLKNKYNRFKISLIDPTTLSIHLAAGPRDFVDDVSKDDILVIRLWADALPLRILSQADIVPQEGVADTANKGLVG